MALQLGCVCVRDSNSHLHRKLKEGCCFRRQGGGSLGGKKAALEAVVGVWKCAERREMEMMRLQFLKFSL